MKMQLLKLDVDPIIIISVILTNVVFSLGILLGLP